MKRYCEHYIAADLNKKMVLLGGPRQVGKTTLSTNLCDHASGKCEYFNWDVDEDRRAILRKEWRQDAKLIIFDELHKYPKWKQWLKGVYDAKVASQQLLVTGSARLDVYKHGGDFLLGRYHYWRLHPFSLDEHPDKLSVHETYDRLLTFGGFPEPFLLADEREARRWRRERFDRLLREDIRDLENIRDIQLLRLFIDQLRNRVGGMIVLSNLAHDLEIAPKTAKHWLDLIERMYIAFRVLPLSRNIARAIKKPPKVFFYDIADTLNDQGARLENLVATHLLKRLHFMEDYYGYTYNLHYLRDKDNREIDFVIVKDNIIEGLIEVKQSDVAISSALKYYTKKLQPKYAVQIVGNLKRSFTKDGILITTPVEFFSNNIPWKTKI